MPRFFIDYTPEVGGAAVIEGADARHIGGALRMTAGEALTLCDGRGTDYACTVTAVEKERVTLSVDAATPSVSEPSLAVTLYMGLPKGDKMELIIQKAVELGVYQVIPVASKRAVVKLDEKKAKSKIERWQGIAEAAAKQSKRGIIPQVGPVMTMKQAVEFRKGLVKRGYYLVPADVKRLCLMYSHTKEDIDGLFQVAEDTLKEMKK